MGDSRPDRSNFGSHLNVVGIPKAFGRTPIGFPMHFVLDPCNLWVHLREHKHLELSLLVQFCQVSMPVPSNSIYDEMLSQSKATRRQADGNAQVAPSGFRQSHKA
ncbi:unnamed protein product [Lupinus luteus]|uniref:Uncharacterized protein n=1 Tax=Lupinus luteus TaxID=3873 RepID=A0AAV1XAB3_LUPLU